MATVPATIRDLRRHWKPHKQRLIATNPQHSQSCALLQSIPGIGKILSLVLLYEIHCIERFPSVGEDWTIAGARTESIGWLIR